MTVVVPLCALVLGIALQQRNRDHLSATVLGQRYMEQMLVDPALESETYWEEERKWRIVRHAWDDERRVVFRVQVFRRSDPRPYAVFTTVRLR